MPRTYASSIIDAPVHDVWARIRDFNGLPVWNAGAIARGEIEDGLAGDQVGAIRGLWLPDGTHIRERLLAHSDLERSYTYDFQQSPFDMDNYIGTLRLHPVTDGDRTFIEWFATFDCNRDEQDALKGLFENIVYQGAFDALKAHYSGA
jgi:hypothetical protein